MSKAEIWDAFEKNRVFWVRLDPKTIRVYMQSDGNGSHCENLDKIKAFVEQRGFYELARGFDQLSAQGYSDFKEKRTA